MKTWRIADIGTFFKNSFIAIMKGDFLKRINAGKYFIHIAYTFFLFCMVIWLSLAIETTMSKVEKNKAVIRELEIVNSQKVYDLARIGRRTNVEQSLLEMGSRVTEADRPATLLGNE